MTLIITCLTADCIVSVTDSALIIDGNKKRSIDNATKLIRIPYINSMISYYGDAEINGSTEYWIKRVVDTLYGKVSNVSEFSKMFENELKKIVGCDRVGFHISGFVEENGSEKHFFAHWSNEKEGEPDEAGDCFKVVSPTMEEFLKKFNYKYLYLFFNGDHETFNTIFNNYKKALTELESNLKKDNNYYNPHKVKRLLEGLMTLIISTCELLDHEHIGGNIQSNILIKRNSKIFREENQEISSLKTIPITEIQNQPQLNLTSTASYTDIGSFSPGGQR